jgi:L-lactate dehydrogenase complex protein LldG
MTDTRIQMLERIRRSLESALLPEKCDSLPPPAHLLEVGNVQLVEGFIREVNAINAHIFPAATSAQAAEIVIDLLRKAAAQMENSGSSYILAWDDAELPLPEVGSAVRAAGFVPLDTHLPDDRELRQARLAELGRASAGLTGAQGGLADTGTLCILSGTGRPRLASLLPPVHIALLSKKAIFPGMAAFLAACSASLPQASNLVFITGPSRTADIEQTLTLGVHGPREVFVVLLD